MDRGELQEVLRKPRCDETERKAHRADQHRNDHPETVREPSHQHAPSPNPIMVSVKGSEASPRAMANSACSGGSATTIEYIPEPPIVIKASAIQRRVQAYGESASRDARSVFMSQAALRSVNASRPMMTASSAMADSASDQWIPIRPPMIP